jgi:hypothetical protein
MELFENDVFKLRKPKEREVVHVKKIGEEFVRGGFNWQGFKMWDFRGNKFKNNINHCCCLGCGDYFRVPLKNKDIFPTAHTHVPLPDVQDHVNVNGSNIEDYEATPILLYFLIKFICNSNITFVQGASKFLLELIREASVLAHLFQNITPEELFPKVSAAKLSEYVNIMGHSKNMVLLADLKG